jgi:hypothetical protein
MLRIDPALEAAISAFSTQPGVTPAQVAQLRTTMQSDADLLGGMNSLASSGNVRGFSVAPSGVSVPTGRFDPVSGVMMLPASALADSESGAGTSDLHAVLRVQRIVGDFSASSYGAEANAPRSVSPGMVANLEEVLNGSPYLADEIKRSVTTADPAARGHYLLERVNVIGSKAGIGGAYDGDSHTINIPSTALISKDVAGENGAFRANSMTFVLGHEVQHSFDHHGALDAKRSLIAGAKSIAASQGPIHDYTTVVKDYLKFSREDEATAEIAGWNAVHSRIAQSKPIVSPTDVWSADPSRIADFVEADSSRQGVYVMRPGLEANQDLTLPMSKANIEAMGENYFGRPPPAYIPAGDHRNAMALGPNHDLDYPNYYGRYPVEVIAWAESNAPTKGGSRPEVTINMAETGLHEDLLERSGLNLGAKHALQYFDSSQRPSVPKTFNSMSNAPSNGASGPIAPERSDPAAVPFDSALHRELRNALPNGASEDRIAQIAAIAKQGGIEAGAIRTMDVVGERLMLTGATPGTHACVELATPPPPADQSNAQFSAMVEQQTQAQQIQMSQQQTGPSMSPAR